MGKSVFRKKRVSEEGIPETIQKPSAGSVRNISNAVEESRCRYWLKLDQFKVTLAALEQPLGRGGRSGSGREEEPDRRAGERRWRSLSFWEDADKATRHHGEL